MMFIVRSAQGAPEGDGVPVGLQIKARRRTPEIVANGAGQTDYFCVGETEAMTALRDQGWDVVELRDGWYAGDNGGGVAMWGYGKYWEIRSEPFTVVEASGPGGAAISEAKSDDLVNVRGAIFGV